MSRSYPPRLILSNVVVFLILYASVKPYKNGGLMRAQGAQTKTIQKSHSFPSVSTAPQSLKTTSRRLSSQTASLQNKDAGRRHTSNSKPAAQMRDAPKLFERSDQKWKGPTASQHMTPAAPQAKGADLRRVCCSIEDALELIKPGFVSLLRSIVRRKASPKSDRGAQLLEGKFNSHRRGLAASHLDTELSGDPKPSSDSPSAGAASPETAGSASSLRPRLEGSTSDSDSVLNLDSLSEEDELLRISTSGDSAAEHASDAFAGGSPLSESTSSPESQSFTPSDASSLLAYGSSDSGRRNPHLRCEPDVNFVRSLSLVGSSETSGIGTASPFSGHRSSVSEGDTSSGVSIFGVLTPASSMGSWRPGVLPPVGADDTSSGASGFTTITPASGVQSSSAASRPGAGAYDNRRYASVSRALQISPRSQRALQVRMGNHESIRCSIMGECDDARTAMRIVCGSLWCAVVCMGLLVYYFYLRKLY